MGNNNTDNCSHEKKCTCNDHDKCGECCCRPERKCFEFSDPSGELPPMFEYVNDDDINNAIHNII